MRHFVLFMYKLHHCKECSFVFVFYNYYLVSDSQLYMSKYIKRLWKPESCKSVNMEPEPHKSVNIHISTEKCTYNSSTIKFNELL